MQRQPSERTLGRRSWGGDGGGDTRIDELAAGGNENFQSGVQHVDGLLVDELVLVICLHTLGLLNVNLGGNGIDLAIYLKRKLVELNPRHAWRNVDR